MVHVIVCVKHAINETELQVSDGRLMVETAPSKISEIDKNAVEEAIRIKEKHGGDVTVLTMGPESAKNSIREALAMGCDQAYLLIDPLFEKADTLGTSYLLASAVRKIGDFDLIVCGEGSSDMYSCQTGSQLAEWLDLPVITYVRSISLDGTFRAERSVEEGIEVVESELPCLITVTQEINEPRLPPYLQIMAASKKSLIEWGVEQLGISKVELDSVISPTEVISLEPLTMVRKNIVLEGTVGETVDQLVKLLLKEGVT